MPQLVVTEQDAQDFKAVMATPEGRRLLFLIINRACNPHDPVFDPKVHDGACLGAHMAFGDGSKDVGRLLMSEMAKHAPDEFTEAKHEAADAWLEDDQLRRAKATKSATTKETDQ